MKTITTFDGQVWQYNDYVEYMRFREATVLGELSHTLKQLAIELKRGRMNQPSVSSEEAYAQQARSLAGFTAERMPIKLIDKAD